MTTVRVHYTDGRAKFTADRVKVEIDSSTGALLIFAISPVGTEIPLGGFHANAWTRFAVLDQSK